MEEGVPLYTAGGQALAEANHENVCRLYDATFSVPPFTWTDEGSADHRNELADARQDPTFGIVVATIRDALAGFAYGCRLLVDHGWWQGFTCVLSSDLTAEWEGRTFALLNLAVDASHRGKGIGKRLIDLLLESRQEERAVLSVQPAATQTQAIYRHLGWQKVGRKGPVPNGVTPFWDIYLMTLR